MITLSQSSSEVLAKVLSRRMPALQTRMSTLPKASSAVFRMFSPPWTEETSSPLATASPPAALISATTFSAAALVPVPEPSREPPRSFTTTFAPSLANSLA